MKISPSGKLGAGFVGTEAVFGYLMLPFHPASVHVRLSGLPGHFLRKDTEENKQLEDKWKEKKLNLQE